MLLRLNMVVVQKNAYCRSIMMQILNMMYQREHKLPAWQMLSRSTAVFNEEVGEHSFSILSRLVLGDTTKCSFSHMDTMYGLIHTYRSNNDDISNDQFRKTRPNKRYNLQKKHETLAAVQAFMLHTIRQIKAGTHTIYSGKRDKHNPAYHGAAAAASRLVPRTETSSMWELSTAVPLNSKVNTMRKQALATYFGTWAGKNCEAEWPEMKSFPLAAAASVALSGSALEGEDSSAGEEDGPLEESTSAEEPDEPPSSSESSDEDAPGPKPVVPDPYDAHDGWAATAEPEEKAPEKAEAKRGRPASGRGSRGKRGRGK
jgi:hypothetical protein